MKKWLFFICIFIFSGCSSDRQEKAEAETLGRYVYIDSHNILHSKTPCVLGMKVTEDEGEGYYKSIQFIDTTSITTKHLQSLCPWCINDDLFDQLKQIVERHDLSQEIIDYVPGK